MFFNIGVLQIILFFSLVLFVNTQFSLWLPMYLFLINYLSTYLSYLKNLEV